MDREQQEPITLPTIPTQEQLRQSLSEGGCSSSPSDRDVAPQGAESPWYITHKGYEAWLTVHENEVSVQVIKPQLKEDRPPRRREGDIQTFSKKSRLRMLRLVNQIRTAPLSHPVFITLTAPHSRVEPADMRDKHFPAFLKALKEIVGSHAYLWRLEFHKDGYPHIHMLVWSYGGGSNINDQALAVQLKRRWWNIIGLNDHGVRQHSCKIDQCYGKRGVLKYISKYVAKEDPNNMPALSGRRWGRSHNLSTAPIYKCIMPPNAQVLLRQTLAKHLHGQGGWADQNAQYLAEHGRFFLWIPWEELGKVVNVPGLEPLYQELLRFKAVEGPDVGYDRPGWALPRKETPSFTYADYEAMFQAGIQDAR